MTDRQGTAERGWTALAWSLDPSLCSNSSMEACCAPTTKTGGCGCFAGGPTGGDVGGGGRWHICRACTRC